MNAASVFRRFRNAEAGFTIIEVVFAAGIILVVAAAVLSSLVYAARTTGASNLRDKALAIANERIERARNLPYDSVGVKYASGAMGDPPGVILTPASATASGTTAVFAVNTAISWIRDPVSNFALYKVMKVTVSWNTSLQSGSVSLSTDIYGKSTIANAGHLAIYVLDADTAQAIPDASVNLDPAMGNNRVVITDYLGEAFFGYVPTGDCTVTPTKTGYLIDTTSTTIANDAITQKTLPAQRPSQGIITVTHEGQPLGGADVWITGSHGTYTGTTGANGEAAVFDNLWKDTYRITASKSSGGYQATNGTLTVTAGNMSATATVDLPGPGRLVVYSRDASGAVAGASITVRGPSPSTANVAGSPGTADATGTTAFEDLAPGTYWLDATAAGHSAATQTVVTVLGDQTTTRTVMLPVVAYGDLKVVVRNNHNTLYDNVRVRVYSPQNSPYIYDNNNWYSGTTGDGTGVFIIHNLVPGTYWAARVGGGSPTPIPSGNVVAGQTTTVNLTLTIHGP
jgi:type II secretory pathway pseudopilin PulG